MIPHWITLPLFSLLALLISATSVFAVAGNQVYECTTYLQEKNVKEAKNCGVQTFETKNPEHSSYNFNTCGNVILQFLTKADGASAITHVQLLKLTAEEMKLPAEKRKNKSAKVVSDLVVPEGQLPRAFSLNHREEQHSMTANCSILQ